MRGDVAPPQLFQPGLGCVERLLPDIQQKNLVIGLGQQIDDDPLAHRSRADDGHTPNLVDSSDGRLERFVAEGKCTSHGIIL